MNLCRYGSLFRTSLVGRKVIVSTDPEINYSIFQQEGKSFLVWYTESFMEIFGQESLLAYHGMVHKYLKNLVLHLVSPENLKAKLLPEMDEMTRRHVSSCAARDTVDIKEVASDVIYLFANQNIIFVSFIIYMVTLSLSLSLSIYIYIYCVQYFHY